MFQTIKVTNEFQLKFNQKEKLKFVDFKTFLKQHFVTSVKQTVDGR